MGAAWQTHLLNHCCSQGPAALRGRGRCRQQCRRLPDGHLRGNFRRGLPSTDGLGVRCVPFAPPNHALQWRRQTANRHAAPLSTADFTVTLRSAKVIACVLWTQYNVETCSSLNMPHDGGLWLDVGWYQRSYNRATNARVPPAELLRGGGGDICIPASAQAHGAAAGAARAAGCRPRQQLCSEGASHSLAAVKSRCRSK